MENQNNNPTLDPDAPIDQNKLDAYKENLRTEQDFTKAILAGAVATIIGAALWGLITSLTGYQIGYMALGVGFLVGMAIRYAGKGIDPEYGYLGAVLSLVGCFFGNYLGVILYVAKSSNVDFFAAYKLINTVDSVSGLMMESFGVIDFLFYGIAIYEGYKFSFRPITDEEILANA